MGAEEVIYVLEKNKDKELTSKEIAEATSIVASCVRRILNSLRKDVSVNLKFRNLTFEEKKEKFGYIVNPNVRVYRIID